MTKTIRLLQLFFCLLLFFGCGKPLDLDSARVFQEAERTFAQAKSPDDYLKTAAMYQEILDRGYVSGAVLYNQGNAFMRAGQRGRAVAAYRQARRFMGPDPFLEANLAYAVGNQPPARRRLLIDYILFWQDWISYPAKFLFAACGMGITLALAIAALFIRRRLLTQATLTGLAASLLFILSAAYDWHRYQWNIHGVVVQKQTVVRKGDAESYEPALTTTLEEGAEFELVERRGDWILIRLPGDQEGWVPERAVVLY
ncbi:MAG: SH3 domain-containing protein [Thermoguttaceae bacterium]